MPPVSMTSVVEEEVRSASQEHKPVLSEDRILGQIRGDSSLVTDPSSDDPFVVWDVTKLSAWGYR